MYNIDYYLYWINFPGFTHKSKELGLKQIVSNYILCVGSSYLELYLGAQSFEADYRETEGASPFPLLVTRRLLSSCAKQETNNAMSIRIRKS